jgi:hypothetical protein
MLIPLLSVELLPQGKFHHFVRDCASIRGLRLRLDPDPRRGCRHVRKRHESRRHQALGGSVTVRTPMGLFRIAPADIGALGVDAISYYARRTRL